MRVRIRYANSSWAETISKSALLPYQRPHGIFIYEHSLGDYGLQFPNNGMSERNFNQQAPEIHESVRAVPSANQSSSRSTPMA
jgi:hypothetical protein